MDAFDFEWFFWFGLPVVVAGCGLVCVFFDWREPRL